MKFRHSFFCGAVALTSFAVGCYSDRRAAAQNKSTPATIQKFIDEQKEISTDKKRALSQYAQFLQNILDDKVFDELRALSCIGRLGGPYERKFKELELMVEGKILNTPEKIRKYFEHEGKSDGTMIRFPEVTRENCIH